MIRILKYIAFILIACFSVSYTYGQKKEISQAKQFVKAGNNLEQAENMMRKLLADSTNRRNVKVWNILFNAIKKQYEQGNEKLYLKQQYDTAKLFITTRKMFEVLEAFDSIQAVPDKHGKVKLKYRDKHATFLDQYRLNLYHGGTYFIKKQNFKEAFLMLDSYIKCASQPLFQSYKYIETDNMLPEAAYWATYCGYKMSDTRLALQHSKLALTDSIHHVYLIQYLAETYKEENDTAGYIQNLKEGFLKYPQSPYFFPRLVEYYSHKNDYVSAMKVVDTALAIDSTEIVYRFAKSSLLLNTGQYEECIKVSDKLIVDNDSLADAFLFAGLSYYNQALELERIVSKAKGNKAKIIKKYQKAYPYLERYRELAPEQKNKWGVPLYKIYYNLNMGKKFEEIDKLIREEKNDK